jgi:hypothetical protein
MCPHFLYQVTTRLLPYKIEIGSSMLRNTFTQCRDSSVQGWPSKIIGLHVNKVCHSHFISRYINASLLAVEGTAVQRKKLHVGSANQKQRWSIEAIKKVEAELKLKVRAAGHWELTWQRRRVHLNEVWWILWWAWDQTLPHRTILTTTEWGGREEESNHGGDGQKFTEK